MAEALSVDMRVGSAHAFSVDPRDPSRTRALWPVSSVSIGQGWEPGCGTLPKGPKQKIAILGRPATPAEILLGSLNHPALRLRKPIPLKIDREDEHVVAAWQEFDEFGYGAHLTVALEDFRQTLVELYLSLEADQKNLGPELQALWRSLQEWIVKK